MAITSGVTGGLADTGTWAKPVEATRLLIRAALPMMNAFVQKNRYERWGFTFNSFPGWVEVLSASTIVDLLIQIRDKVFR